MEITRVSILTGIERTREIDVTAKQMVEWIGGRLIQDVMPHLSEGDREFIMTGITEEEWDEAFSNE
jgi:hypothetical protein